jgi:hypothetical protein
MQIVCSIFINCVGMTTNGPAIWGGCVTRRKHRHKAVPVGYKAVPVQGGYGVVFAIPVQC